MKTNYFFTLLCVQLLTHSLSFSSIMTVSPDGKSFDIQESRHFPVNCKSLITITKGSLSRTLEIKEKESAECGLLTQITSELSLSFEENIDSCGVIRTSFYSQSQSYYEIADHTYSTCGGTFDISLKLSPESKDFASITENHKLNTNEDEPYHCMAYFEGFYIDEKTGECLKGAQSGCSNPFPFQTLESCQTRDSNSASLFSVFKF